MVTKLVVRAIIHGEVVDLFEYEPPITEELKYHLRIFLELNESLHPGCTFEVTRFKDGLGERFKPDRTGTGNLW